MIKVEIKHRFTSAALFTAEVDANINTGLRIKVALQLAVKARADLGGAYLRGADLRGAYLRGADLRGAYLRGADLGGAYLGGADLGGAYLGGADLGGADLRGADLGGAYLRGAYLGGAYLGGAYLGGAYLGGAYLGGAYLGGAYLGGAKGDGNLLVGERHVLQIGPLGSRSDYLLAFLTEQGIRIRAGCFSGSLDEFKAAVAETHGYTNYGKEYAVAILMIEAHATIWLPSATQPEKVAA